jgi:hypothetical protein
MSEQFFIYAKPLIHGVNHETIYLNNSAFFTEKDLNILVYGKDLKELTAVYLSSTNVNMFDNLMYINHFSKTKNLSANNPPFSGIVIPIFIYKENYVAFSLPQIPKTTGYIDIIVENEAGYGKLTTGSYHPFLSSWRGAIDIQSPSISGIHVYVS